MRTTPLIAAVLLTTTPVQATIETFESESAYLDALAAHGYVALVEGFEGSDWDPYRTVNPFDPQSAPSVTSQGITWSGNAEITTNTNWGRNKTWGIFTIYEPPGSPDELIGESDRVLYGVGGWFDSNPNFGADFVIELDGIPRADRAAGAGHVFIGVIDTDGFTTFRVIDAEQEAVFGADDFTFCTTEVLGDVNGDGVVDFADLLAVLAAWGDCPGCPEDVNGDDVVDFADLLIVLANWT